MNNHLTGINRKPGADGLSSKNLLKTESPWVHAADTNYTTEAPLASARRLALAMRHTVPVAKEKVCRPSTGHGSDLQAMRRRPEAATQKLADQKHKLSELVLKVQLLTEAPVCSGDLDKILGTRGRSRKLHKRALEFM